MENVTKLKVVSHGPKAAHKPSKWFARRMKRQTHAAVGIGVIAGTLIALSLSHLAHGIEIVTAAPSWESWAMAVGIDLGFVALEMAGVLAATASLRKEIHKYSRPAIVGTLIGSAAMNAFAFAAPCTSYYLMAAAIVLGVAIPGMVYALTKIGAAMYLATKSA
jgi:hypothetical protein